MSLTGIEELNGIVRIIHNLGQAVEVGEKQMRSLVCGKTTSETYQQGIGIDFVHQRNHT